MPRHDGAAGQRTVSSGIQKGQMSGRRDVVPRGAQEAVKDAWHVSNWAGVGEFAETGNLQEVRLEGRRREELPRRRNGSALRAKPALDEGTLKGSPSRLVTKKVLRQNSVKIDRLPGPIKCV